MQSRSKTDRKVDTISTNQKGFHMKLGFIGLGIMGKPMAINLVNAGHELVVFDLVEAPVKELVALGAKAVNSSKLSCEVFFARDHLG